MSRYNIYWGETHDNTYQYAEMPAAIDAVIARAASHLDFYAAAYYTACSSAFQVGGHLAEKSGRCEMPLEGWKPDERLEREWRELKEATRSLNQPGQFVTFPGYEWQGNGSGGDHNVFAVTEDGFEICRANTLKELYAALQGKKVFAIPHHTAYRIGVRGRDWSVFDESLSPFSELFSIHGCSETDEEWIGMRGNSHMGPGFGGGTYQAALDLGWHVGAIASTDNWGDMPGQFGRGRMACLAHELTREGLWEAFAARRVYGVTGDRIKVDFQIGDAVMGAIVKQPGPRQVRVNVVGSDAIDRIELLRNGRVIATHAHQGTWQFPAPEQRSRFKLRIECGWGPRASEMELPDREWHGRLRIAGGRMLSAEPCWISPGQQDAGLEHDCAVFALTSRTRDVSLPWQNANVFEFEAEAQAEVSLELNGLREQGRLDELAGQSRELWYRDECVRMLADKAGIEPESPERQDIYHHVAYKAKLHRVIPEAGYTASLEYEDDEPIDGEVNYRVRVEQRNGQRAWSSPIWVSG